MIVAAVIAWTTAAPAGAAPAGDDGAAFRAVATRDAAFEAIAERDVADAAAPRTYVPAAPRIADEENLVSARKRGESMEQIPVSVGRFGPAQLSGGQVRRLDDASGRAANLLIGSAMGLPNSARASLRGTAQNDPDSTVDPGVGVYLDGVYLARAQGQLLTLTDTESVEVIRGPQGTIFGKNALGGAINVVTRKPDFDYGGHAELRVGNFGLLETRAALNVPLVPEKAAARLALATKTRDGFVKNIVNGDDYSDDKELYGRLELLVLPWSDVEVLLTADHSIQNRKPLGGKCVLTGGGTGLSKIPGAVTGFNEACKRDQARSDFEFASDVRFAKDDLRTWGAAAQISWDVTRGLLLTSVSSVRTQSNERFLDADSNPVNFSEPQLGGLGRTDQLQLSQELRLNGRSQGGRTSYVLGLYGFRDGAEDSSFDGLGFLAPTQEQFRTRNFSYEGFGQLSYDFTDRLEATVGLRRTNELKRLVKSESSIDRLAALALPGTETLAAIRALPDGQLRRLAVGAGLSIEALRVALADPKLAEMISGRAAVSAFENSLLPNFGFERSARFVEWSPSAALSYRIGDASLLYASYGTGFRSGGFNGRASQPADISEVKPEQLTSYEIGVKSSFLGDRLVLNASAFYNIAKDVQLGLLSVDEFLGLTRVIRRNASKERLRGGELSVTWVPLQGLRLGADIGILRNRYDGFDKQDLPDPSIADEQPILSPDYTMNFTAQYRVPVRLGVLGLRLDWSQVASYNNDVQGTEAIETRKHGLLDGRLSFELPDGRTELAVFGTNLLNRSYIAGGIGFDESFGFATRFFGPPRFYGLEVRRTF